MITLNISPETWDKAVGHMVLGHTRHSVVAETSLRDALKVLGVEVSVSEAPTCGNCKWWQRTGVTFGQADAQGASIGSLMGRCKWGHTYVGTTSTHTCEHHTPEGSE